VDAVLVYLGATGPSFDFAPLAILIGCLFFVPIVLLLILKRDEVPHSSRSGAPRFDRSGVGDAREKRVPLRDAYVLQYRFQDSAGRERDRTRTLSRRAAFMWREGQGTETNKCRESKRLRNCCGRPPNRRDSDV
jgi:hypothetical protein